MIEVKLSRRGKILLLLPIFLVAISMYLSEPYVAVTAALLFSLFFYSRAEIANCSVNIEDRLPEGNKTVGEAFKVQHKVKGSRVLDLKFSKKMNDEFELKGKDEEEQVRTGSRFSYQVIPQSRGYHKLGKIEVWLYDPLRIYKKEIEHDIEEEVVVRSSKEAIKRAKTYSKRKHAEEFVEDPFAFTQRSNEFEGIREFHPGDSLRDIHWKSFSKFQKLMTRIYERVSPIGAQILLDCSPSMRRKLPNGTTKLDHSIYVSLQMLKNFETLGHEIGMTAYDHKKVIFHKSPDLESTIFRMLYEKVSDLPGAIDPKDMSMDRYDDSLDLSDLDSDEKRFSEKIGKFISKSGRKDIAGVLSAVDQIKAREEKRKLVIIISDLEMQAKATLKAVEHLKEMKHEVWLIVPFSPWYDVEEVEEKTLEKAYQEYEKLENILGYIERLGCPIFELYPDREGFTILEEWGERKT
ncbi:MAG: DUF58 domain-containing protein [Candidatus Thermoplasmatota archaeon]|nr:DUF58 domain-containing protein [Candidatus Thermoplasmatota archaeon]